MGNSLLDVVVFGREAGIEAGKMFKGISSPEGLNLQHVKDFEKERDAAGIKKDLVSPKLLPRYTHGNPEFAPSANDQYGRGNDEIKNGAVKN